MTSEVIGWGAFALEKLCFMSNVSAEVWSGVFQGVGTLVVSAIAVWTVFKTQRFQRLLNEESLKLRKLDQFSGLIKIAKEVEGIVGKIKWSVEETEKTYKPYPIQDLQDIKENSAHVALMLNQFALSDLPEYKFVSELVRLREIVSKAPILAEELASLLLMKQENIGSHMTALMLYPDVVEKIVKSLEKAESELRLSL